MLTVFFTLVVLIGSLVTAQVVNQEDTGVSHGKTRYEAVRRGLEGYCAPPCSRRDLCCRDKQDINEATFCARRLTDSSDDESCRANADNVERKKNEAGGMDDEAANGAGINQEDMGEGHGKPRYQEVRRGSEGYCAPPCSRRDLCCRDLHDTTAVTFCARRLTDSSDDQSCRAATK